MKIRKSEERNRTPRAAMFKHGIELSSIGRADQEDIDEAQLRAQDGDSVPQPLDDWADIDDTNRWLDEHRFGDDDQFSIN